MSVSLALDPDQLRYAIVTPVRDEAANLGRLAGCIAAQTQLPERWVIVDNGSSDETAAIALNLAAQHDWVVATSAPGEARAVRGAPIVRAFHHGLERLGNLPDVVVKLDADLTMDADYFERLVAAFANDEALGIASGLGYEEVRPGEWAPKLMSKGSVWGASRAYRSECLLSVTPLEEGMGWDGIDVLKANMNGWRSESLTDIPFRHHRPEGQRDGSRFRAYAAQGIAAHYMGYKLWYLVLRATNRMRYERWAVGMVWGYVASVVERRPRCADPAVVRFLRERQRLRDVPRRRREVLEKT